MSIDGDAGNEKGSIGSPRRISESVDEALSQRSVRIPQTQDAQVDEGGFAAQLPVADAGAFQVA